MEFPQIRDRNEALSTIDLVVHDERLRELDNWFTDERKKALLISQASEAYPELSGGAVALSSDDTPQLGQVRTLISRWNRARPARFPREPSLESLVRAAEPWDFRLGLERDAIPGRTALLPDSLRELIDGIAADWRMRDTVAPAGAYDAVVPIGGLIRANIGRPASVARWLQHGLSTGAVLGLASERVSSRGEADLARSMGLPDRSEQDALRYGLEQAFHLDPHAWMLSGDNLWKQDECVPPMALAVVRPSSDGRRATTEQGVRWALLTTGFLERSTVLLVSSTIYWISNQISARIVLPDSTSIATTGYEMADAPGPPIVFASQHYLQEIKAAVDALPKLWRWAQGEAGV